MANILILGGGFGGVAAAHRLRTLLSKEHEITVIDRRDYFMVGFRKTWAILGEHPPEDGQRKLAELEKFGIRYLQGSIDSIDPEGLSVVVNGQTLEADAMIVALGASLAPDAVPGFAEHALSVYDPEQMAANAARIGAFQGGRVLVGVFTEGYKCPPGPYEMAILLKEHLDRREVPAEVTVFTPLPVSLPVLDQVGCDSLDGYMVANGVRFLPGRKATRVEAGSVQFEDGSSLPYDLLLGVAPHRPPAVVRTSGLLEDGPWIKVNPHTLETKFPGVYAVGDVTVALMANGKPLPKAGVFAEGGALIAAERIAARIHGREPMARFEGHGGCFLEVGGGRAVMIRGDFLATGGPEVELTSPAEAFMDEKWSFEKERLKAWFG